MVDPSRRRRIASPPAGDRARGQGRERQQGGPALRPVDQPLRRPPRGRRTPELAHERRRLVLVHRERGRAELEQPTLGAPARERQVDRLPTRQRHLRPARQVGDELRERVEARPVGDAMRVVDDHEGGCGPIGERRQQPTDHRPRGHRWRRDRVEERPVGGRDARPARPRGTSAASTGSLSPSSAVSQATDRRSARRPLGQDTGLAVPGRRDDRDEAPVTRRAEPTQQPGAQDRTPGGRSAP